MIDKNKENFESFCDAYALRDVIKECVGIAHTKPAVIAKPSTRQRLQIFFLLFFCIFVLFFFYFLFKFKLKISYHQN